MLSKCYANPDDDDDSSVTAVMSVTTAVTANAMSLKEF